MAAISVAIEFVYPHRLGEGESRLVDCERRGDLVVEVGGGSAHS